MNVQQIVNGPMQENCYLVFGKKEVLIVDPGSYASYIQNQIEQTEKKPVAILLTHAHFDHIGAVDDLVKTYNIPVYLNEKEASWLKDPEMNLSSFMVAPLTCQTLSLPLKKEMHIGEFLFTVRNTPGHSFGSVSFIFDTFALVGDTLFKQSIGRSDFPTGNMATLLQSIKTKLFSLPDETKIYPGHGQATTIKREKRENPFVH